MKTEIELQAAKVVKDWVDRFYELTVNDKPLDKVYEKKLKSCDVCYTGDFRSRIGLSRQYFLKEKHKDYCHICLDFANNFYLIKTADWEVRRRYVDTLTNLLDHMKEAHGYDNKEKCKNSSRY